jgi:hypothetical protein
VADINQGLYVLRYQGQHQEQVAQVAFAEGNSNLTATLPSPSPSPSVAHSPALHRGSGTGSRGGQPVSTAALIFVGLLLIVVVGIFAATRVYRRRS